MNGEFAKIFEVEGHQVLIHADKNDDNEPCITASLQADMGRIDLSFAYHDEDSGWDKRDHNIAKVLAGDEFIARKAYEQVKDMGFLDAFSKPVD
ncbi:hypothetical protein ACT3UJ_02205 [Halomonas sp. 86]|uniref:hypothetical protein n=1 Tax=unclassified Halomonas TaxID=2609666 RepID=UPI00403434AF